MSRMLNAVAFAAIAARLSSVSFGQEKTFEIRGSVVVGDRGLANVEVSLRGNGLGDERKSATDERGEFSFAGLPAGHFDLQVRSAPLFLRVDVNLDQSLTLLLPLEFEGYPCPHWTTQPQYFLLLDPDDKNLSALSGTVKGKGGGPVEGANVALYIPKQGRIATTRTTNDGSFSFASLTFEKDYWIQVLSDGYFVGEFTTLKVLPGYKSVYGDFTLESCQPGHCEPYLRQIHIIPPCE
jgi:hypothetical protein